MSLCRLVTNEYDINNVRRREPKGAVQQVIELVYGGKLLQEFGAVDLLRPLKWSPVEVSCASGRVSVSYDGRSFFDAVYVNGYAPTDAWEIGIGASTGTWTNTHKLSRVRLQLGALVDRSDVVVELSSNGQQFVSSGLRFAYFPTPAISFIRPETGPLLATPSSRFLALALPMAIRIVAPSTAPSSAQHSSRDQRRPR